MVSLQGNFSTDFLGLPSSLDCEDELLAPEIVEQMMGRALKIFSASIQEGPFCFGVVKYLSHGMDCCFTTLQGPAAS